MQMEQSQPPNLKGADGLGAGGYDGERIRPTRQSDRCFEYTDNAIIDKIDKSEKRITIPQLIKSAKYHLSSSEATYDNTESGLEAENVQDAINELQEESIFQKNDWTDKQTLRKRRVTEGKRKPDGIGGGGTAEDT